MAIILPDGATYAGETKDNLPHGHGKAVWPDGRTYEGQWENGKMNGLGTIAWPNGNVYLGQFSDGKIHGIGNTNILTGSKGWESGLMLMQSMIIQRGLS